MSREHKDIFFQGRTHGPHPHKLGPAGLLFANKPSGLWGSRPFKNISLYSLIVVLFFFPTKIFASVAGEVNKANDLYKQGKFDDSLKLYQEALDQEDKSSVIKYDLGTALYKKGDYSKALGYLEQAAQDKNFKIKPKAEYNLGNVLYKSGMQKANTDVEAAIKTLQEALGHYGQTIAVDPKDQDAIFNQDFVKKEIELLKKQKQNQKQEQQKRQNQQNQQNQQKQQNQQNKQNQQKRQENQQSQQNKSKDQKNKQSSSEPQAQKQRNAQAQAEENQKEFDRKQAEDFLEEYQENEEPKKLLSYMPKKIDDRPVLKDW